MIFYKNDFKYTNWIKKESNHYIFHYFKNSVAERDIEYIIKTQERTYKKISSFLRLSLFKKSKRIHYYFYPNKKVKKELMGDDWYAQAICKEMAVHTLYTNKIKPIGAHEDAHLLILPFGFPNGFAQEGFAEFMSGRDWYGNDLNKTAKEGINKGFIKLNPALLYSHFAWNKIENKYLRYYYAFAGSFIGSLIKNYGRNKFLKLYKELKRNYTIRNKKIYFKIYKETPDILLKKWLMRR